MKKVVLTIAGSDSSGGAGIQADTKAIAAHRQYAMSVITALTAQNTMGVTGIFEVTPDFVTAQMDAVFTDIPPHAVKVGMVSNAEIIKAIAAGLRKYAAKNIVVDPVMVATSGSRLMDDAAKETLVGELFPLAALVTPNIPEAEVLCGFEIHSRDDMFKAAEAICQQYSCNVLVKGGHLEGDAADILLAGGEASWFTGLRVDNHNTHGTGCTLSSAIACGLAAGKPLQDSVAAAKEYISGALAAGLDLGQGAGPVEHMWRDI
ncbi:MAG: bifunctional hydroxymethylpyrimidine kinase/phosphomethylpyrimidine kinase [Defluviitaleaceae bacterium]|nr:bifunctional hydroxymethylpyrimidine kinase/phosphomethylpyrimidine kinase [Defluviitaleaceae bacterium]